MKERNVKYTKPYPNRRRIVDVCLGIFAQNSNQALYIQSIWNRMRQRHWKTNGKTPHKTVSKRLNYDHHFIRVGPNIFKMNPKAYAAHKRNTK